VSFRAQGEHLAVDLPGATALFTTRRGGVSEGPYASLNLGLWTDDDPERVHDNRERVR
jgi:polyphenol oxidase